MLRSCKLIYSWFLDRLERIQRVLLDDTYTKEYPERFTLKTKTEKNVKTNQPLFQFYIEYTMIKYLTHRRKAWIFNNT